MTYVLDAIKGKIQHPKAIILLICVIACCGGIVLVFIADHPPADTLISKKNEDWLAPFSILVVLFNFFLFFLEKTEFAQMSTIFMLSLVDFNSSSLYANCAASDVRILAIIGFILMIISTLASFVALPISWDTSSLNMKSPVNIARLVTSFALGVGNLLLWIDLPDQQADSFVIQPFFLSFVFTVAVILNVQYLIDISFYGAGILLYSYWMALTDNSGLSLVGYILVVASLVVTLVLHIIDRFYSGVGDGFVERFKARITQSGAVNKIITTTCLVAFCLVVVGCILAWVEDDGGDHANWTAVFSLVIVTFNLLQWFLEFNFLAPVALAIAYGSRTYIAFFDATVSAAHTMDTNNHTVASIAYALQFVAVILSFIVFYTELTVTMPAIADKMNIIVMVNTLLLVVGNVLLWAGLKGVVVVSPILLALFYVCVQFWQLQTARPLAYILPAYLVQHYWLGVVDGSGATLVGFILCCAAFVIMTVVYCFSGDEERSKYQEVGSVAGGDGPGDKAPLATTAPPSYAPA
eukprot:TRINITY_DN63558_c0_g1_i1.p1 TRINITY_DN63558_c0_g1~~TRINITY_DN63558_c0_g1_i1.p1  ORF type:complete len:532 (+),score=44.94 TRINITY_DN63558_c0_g1_i1:29-1597(+)